MSKGQLLLLDATSSLPTSKGQLLLLDATAAGVSKGQLLLLDATVPTTYTAHAGPDQSVGGMAEVQLDGRGSSGLPDVYEWVQTQGPTVVLSDAGPLPRFEAPASDSGVVLKFTLSVGVVGTMSATDEVSITVAPHGEWWLNPSGQWVGIAILPTTD